MIVSVLFKATRFCESIVTFSDSLIFTYLSKSVNLANSLAEERSKVSLNTILFFPGTSRVKFFTFLRLDILAKFVVLEPLAVKVFGRVTSFIVSCSTVVVVWVVVPVFEDELEEESELGGGGGVVVVPA